MKSLAGKILKSAVVTVPLMFSICPPSQACPSERGRLSSGTYSKTLTPKEVVDITLGMPFLDSYAAYDLSDIWDFFTPEQLTDHARYSIDVYKIVYKTEDELGNSTEASGALLIPVVRNHHRKLPLLSLQRGTIYYNLDAPSTCNWEDWGIWRGLIPASHGYVTAMPDLLGFGESSHLNHPYALVEPTATATVDMIRASREFAKSLGLRLEDREVFLAGLSQGGHATLATQKVVEADRRQYADIEIVASAPAAGGYNLSATINALLGSDVVAFPQLTTLFIMTVNEVYGLNRPLSHYFKEPYASLIPTLHDKTHNNAEILAAFPQGDSAQLYTDEFRAAFKGDGEQEFKAAIAENDLHSGWIPRAPIRFYNGEADTMSPAALAYEACNNLAGPGKDIDVVIIPGAGHLQSIVPITLLTLDWFDAFRHHDIARWHGR